MDEPNSRAVTFETILIWETFVALWNAWYQEIRHAEGMGLYSKHDQLGRA